MAEKEALKVLVVGYGSRDVTFIDRLITGLTKEGVDVTVATSSKKNLEQIKAGKPGWLWVPGGSRNMLKRMAVLTWLMISRPQLRRPAWFSELIAEAQGWRDRIEICYRYLPFTRQTWDVIYFPWNSAAIDYIGLFDVGKPVVVSCRGSQVNIRPYLKGQEDFATGLIRTLKLADAVHCVSKDILGETERFGLERNRAVVIHAAVDPDLFVPAERKKVTNQALKIVTTGSLVWVKGYEYLLMAVGYLRDMGIKAELHIIGEGYERNRILFTIHDLDLEGQVVLLGKLSTEEVREQLEQADIFALASLSEGLPNVVLEAMSCGLPVVTTDCGGVREAVTDGVEGFVVPTRDPRLMAEALKKLANDPELARKMGAAGRERVLKEFRLEDQVSAFITLFDSLRSSDRRSELDE